MTDTIWLGAIAMVPAILGPVLLVLMQNRGHFQEKEQQWAREDKVAQQAAEAAKLLLANQNALAAKTAETAALLLAANERVATATTTANTKLDVIHTLVNSQMTAALQSELDATIVTLALTREVIDLKRIGGTKKANGESLLAVEQLQQKIEELKATIADRMKTAATAKAQIEKL